MYKKLQSLSLGIVILCELFSCSSFGNAPEDKHITHLQKSPRYDLEAEHFINIHKAEMDKYDDSIGFWNKFSVLWNMHEHTSPSSLLPEKKPDLKVFLKPSPHIKFIWLGHSSFLVNMQQKNPFV